ncbi:MAG: general secretion pathway protein GspB [Syntrophotaleaceae bacterium]
MSTILKALQKLEELSNRQEALPGEPDPLWVRPVAGRRRRFYPRWLLLPGLILTLGGIGLFSLSRIQEETDTGRALVSVPPVNGEPVELISKAPEEKLGLSQVEVAPVHTPGLREEEMQEEIQTPVTAFQEQGKTTPARIKGEPAFPRTENTRPRFRVTGIAYQEDRTVRFAIINDRALGEGEIVAGAIVEEILEDRVRFTQDGSSFEVPLARGAAR